MISLNLMEALISFHETNELYYGDLKPQNILFNYQGKIKFGDFGTSYFFLNDTIEGIFYGYTDRYSRPEIKELVIEQKKTGKQMPP